MDLVQELVESYRKAACDLPEDVERALRAHKGSVIEDILKNVEIARKEKIPMCQDTGTPVWYVRRSARHSEGELRKAIDEATLKATEEVPLRHNAFCPVTGKDEGNTPVIYFKEWDKDFTKFDLLLKGGGAENCGELYSVAERDFSAIKNYVRGAVERAGAKGCPPYVLGICVGGSRDEVAHYSKKMLLRELEDVNENAEAAKMEEELMQELNELEIGPMGLGGKPTVLGVKIGIVSRHPASYFVDVSFSCWALRRAGFEWKD